jgi:TrmH family RNA methyltransferase
MESLSKNKIKWIRSLHTKKYRVEEHCFLVEGEKMVLEGIHTFSDHLLCIIVEKEAVSLVPQHVTDRCFVASELEMKQISTLVSPNKLIAVFKQPTRSISTTKSIVLDGIQDPGNMGTILRLADWFGIHQIICSEDTVDCYNPKVVQASMGAIFRISVSYQNLPQFLIASKQPTFGAMLNGTDFRTIEYPENALLILGNEGKGVRPEVQSAIQTAITIPKKGDAESLNVAAAAAILITQMTL